MKHLFFALCTFAFIHSTYSQNVTAPETPDTLSGIVIVLQAGGTITMDTTDGKMTFTTCDEGIIVPYRAWCVRTPIDMVDASMRGNAVGYVTRFYRKVNWAEIPANDVLLFKIRE